MSTIEQPLYDNGRKTRLQTIASIELGVSDARPSARHLHVATSEDFLVAHRVLVLDGAGEHNAEDLKLSMTVGPPVSHDSQPSFPTTKRQQVRADLWVGKP